MKTVVTLVKCLAGTAPRALRTTTSSLATRRRVALLVGRRGEEKGQRRCFASVSTRASMHEKGSVVGLSDGDLGDSDLDYDDYDDGALTDGDLLSGGLLNALTRWFWDDE